ncbi:MAG: diguanylate cyclase [Desulfuromonadales bacterium]|nr:diguanylate cyclase [Desulfuromonadales bacterium]
MSDDQISEAIYSNFPEQRPEPVEEKSLSQKVSDYFADEPKKEKPAEPEMRAWEPTVMERIEGLFSGNKDKAWNELMARKISERDGVSIEEVYQSVGGSRPILNPEGRAPIKSLIEGTGIVAKQLPYVPEATVNSVLRTIRGGDEDVEESWLDSAITATDLPKPTDADPNYQSLYGVGESLGYSMATLTSTVLATAAASAAGTPAAGPAAGFAAGTAVAFRASKDEFLTRVKEGLDRKSEEIHGRPLNQDEWEKAYSEFNSAANKYGAWEAIPEAASNLVFMRALTMPLRGASKARLLDAGRRAAKVMFSEQVTETATGTGQSYAEEEAGLGKAKTIAQAFRDQAVQTAIITGLLGGGGAAAKGTFEAGMDRAQPGRELGREMQAQVEGAQIVGAEGQAVQALEPGQAQIQRKPITEMVADKLRARGVMPEVALRMATSGQFVQPEQVMPEGFEVEMEAPAFPRQEVAPVIAEKVIAEKPAEVEEVAEQIKAEEAPSEAAERAEERPRVAQPHGLRITEHETKAREHGLTVGQAAAFEPQDVRDTVTGFYKAEDRVPTIKRIQEHVKSTGEEAAYIEADISNLGGLNSKLGHTGANRVYRGITDIFEAELNAISEESDVVTFRHGGDEVSAMVVNATKEQVDAALEATEAKVQEYIKNEGLSDLPHPKHKGDPKKAGVGLYSLSSTITAEADFKEIFSEADQALEQQKKEKGIEPGIKIAEDRQKPTRAGEPAGAVEVRVAEPARAVEKPDQRGRDRAGAEKGREPAIKPSEPVTKAEFDEIKRKKVEPRKVSHETIEPDVSSMEEQKEGDYEYLASSSGRVGDNYKPMMDAGGFPAKESGSKFGIGGGKYVVIGKKPVSTQKAREAVGKISKALLYYGKSVKVRGDTKGIYSVNGEFVQTAEKNTSQSIEVLAHELFHYLDEKRVYGKELDSFSRNAAGGYTYNVNAPHQEDGAEFFRVYMTDYPTLRTAAPNEVKQLEELLKTKPDMYKRIKAVQKAMHEHLHQPVELRGDAYIGKEPGFARRFVLSGGVRGLYQSWIDYRKGAFDAAKGVDNREAVMDLVNLPHHVYSFVTETLNSGVPRFEEGQIIFDDKRTAGFAAAVDSLSKQKRKRLWNYIDARRASTLKEEGRERLFSVDVIKEYLGFGKDNDIKRIAAHYDRVMKGMLDFVVENGGLKREVADKFGDNYVNFGRVIEHFSPTEERSGSTFMRMRGGSQLLQDPEQRVLKSITGMMRAAINGRIKRELYSKPNPEYFAPWDRQFKKEDLNFGMVTDMLNELHSQGVVLFDNSFHDKSGNLDMTKVETFLEKNPDMLMSFFAAEPTSTEFDIDSWIDEKGEEHFVAMPKGGLFSMSMANLGKIKRTALGRFFAPVKAVYSHFLIMAAPYIQIPNMMADYLNFPIYTREYNGLAFFRSWIDVAWMGMRAAINTKSVREYSKMGIFDTTANSKLYDLLSLPPTMHVRNKGAINEFFDLVGFPKSWQIENTGTLNANRLLMRLNAATKMLEYERAIKNGKTKKEAAYSANLMVAEWQMRGSSLWVNTLFDLAPFARSYANSISREVLRAAEDPKHIGKRTLKRTAAAMVSWNIRGGMTLGALGIAVYAYMMDDDERKKLWDESTPAQRMRSAYILLTGDTDYTVMQGRLKIPFLYGSYFMGLAWGIMDEWRDVPQREPISEFSLRLARNFVPPSGIVGLDNFVFLGANINPYNWGPIEPQWMKKLPMEYRRGAYTPEFFNSNAESLLSPKQKEFIADRTAGAVGAMAVDIAAAETWNQEQYGERPFALYRPDDRIGGLVKLSTSRAFKNSVSYRNTVFTEAFGELLKEVSLASAQVSSAMHDYRTRGNMELDEYIRAGAEKEVAAELRGAAKADLFMDTGWMNDDQRAANGLALMRASFDVTRRIHYGNTGYYEGIATDFRLIDEALSQFKGKTIQTSYGKVQFPTGYYEYQKSSKDGGTKEALIWAVQRLRNDHIKKLMQERKVD